MREFFQMIGVTLLCMATLTGVLAAIVFLTGWSPGSATPSQENSSYCQQTGGC